MNYVSTRAFMARGQHVYYTRDVMPNKFLEKSVEKIYLDMKIVYLMFYSFILNYFLAVQLDLDFVCELLNIYKLYVYVCSVGIWRRWYWRIEHTTHKLIKTCIMYVFDGFFLYICICLVGYTSISIFILFLKVHY